MSADMISQKLNGMGCTGEDRSIGRNVEDGIVLADVDDGERSLTTRLKSLLRLPEGHLENFPREGVLARCDVFVKTKCNMIVLITFGGAQDVVSRREVNPPPLGTDSQRTKACAVVVITNGTGES